jgi:hypothetical protein
MKRTRTDHFARARGSTPCTPTDLQPAKESALDVGCVQRNSKMVGGLFAKRAICAVVLFLPLLTGTHRSIAQEFNSIKLFDASPAFATGPETSAAEAVPFSTTTLILNFTANDSAIISSTPDGTGPIVIDNYLTINGVNVCEGVSNFQAASCVGGYIKNPHNPKVIGKPIEQVLKSVPPIDVSSIIPVEPGAVVFELRDFGVIRGNTDLFLVTTHNISAFGPEDLAPEPPSVGIVASALSVEDEPYYDRSGHRCPAPVPDEQKIPLNCTQHANCDRNYRNCVPDYVVCNTCGSGAPPPPPPPPPGPPPPPPGPPPLVEGNGEEEDEPQTRCPVAFVDPEPLFGAALVTQLGAGISTGLQTNAANPTPRPRPEPPESEGDGFGTPAQVCNSDMSANFRWLMWMTGHPCRTPKINLNQRENRCRPYVNVRLVRTQPGMNAYSQSGSRWARSQTIRALNSIAAQWALRHDSKPPIRVGDISFLGGGDHPQHLSHDDGLDVDILAVGKDDTGSRVDLLTNPDQYSQERTRELIQIIRTNWVLPVDKIFFDDKQLQAEGLCTPANKNKPDANDHTDHLHVRFRRPSPF